MPGAHQESVVRAERRADLLYCRTISHFLPKGHFGGQKQIHSSNEALYLRNNCYKCRSDRNQGVQRAMVPTAKHIGDLAP